MIKIGEKLSRKKIFTWHIHGNYMYYLSQIDHDFFLPVGGVRSHGYSGKAGTFPWPDNIHEVPVDMVKDLTFDLILYQSKENWLLDQYQVLSPSQRNLPRIYLEHDPPRTHPTDTKHPMDDPEVLLVQVTNFNDLMWDAPGVETKVIEHGIVLPKDVQYSGELEKGIVVVNNLFLRGRRLGVDVFEKVKDQVELDLVGMGSKDFGGLGEVNQAELPRFESQYRFFFNPIRWTSLGLAVCEAMMMGMPVVALATTEMSSVIQNGVSGYIDTSIENLIDYMKELLDNPFEAKKLGLGAKEAATERFSIERFSRDWNDAIDLVCGEKKLKVAR